MESALLAGAFVVILFMMKWDHRSERKAWEADRTVLLDRIQAPVVFQAKAAEAVEPGGVSYVGDESDTAGLTGDGRPDEAEAR
jgi:hypothetical protein